MRRDPCLFCHDVMILWPEHANCDVASPVMELFDGDRGHSQRFHRDPVRAPLQPLFRVTLDGADDGEPGKVGNPLGS